MLTLQLSVNVATYGSNYLIDLDHYLVTMKKHFLFDGQIASFLRFIQDGSFDALPTATHLHVLQQQQTPATTSSLPKSLNEEDRL